MTEPNILGVREILSHFRATVQTACQTGEPVIIALRHRKPAAVLLGFESWQALAKGQAPTQVDTTTLRAELAAERQHSAELAAELAAARRQVEELSRDLVAEHKHVAELEAQRTRPQSTGQTWGQSGAGWAADPAPVPPARLSETWAGQSWGSSAAQGPLKSGWGQ